MIFKKNFYKKSKKNEKSFKKDFFEIFFEKKTFVCEKVFILQDF